jgi:TolB-like protein
MAQMVAENTSLQFGNQSQSLPAKRNSICEKWLSAGEEKPTRYSTDLQRLKRDTSSGSIAKPEVAEVGAWYKKPAALLVAAVAVIGVCVTTWSLFSKPSEAIHSVAVLPFASAAQDANSDDLSDGVTEAIIDTVSQVPGLRVMSRGSVFRYKRKEGDPQQVGRELKVDAVVTGNIVERGDRIILNAELSKVEDDTHLWGKQYESKASDVLALQQQIAGDVSQRLQPQLTGNQKEKLARLPTQNPEAYQLYIRGRYFFDRWSEEGRKESVEYFEQAIGKDSNFAAAYAGLSESYSLIAFFGELPASETRAKAMSAANKALELDKSLAEAHAALGLALFLDLQWTQAGEELEQAVSMNPIAPAPISTRAGFSHSRGASATVSGKWNWPRLLNLFRLRSISRQGTSIILLGSTTDRSSNTKRLRNSIPASATPTWRKTCVPKQPRLTLAQRKRMGVSRMPSL